MTNVGQVSVGLSLDDKEFKRKIIEADNLTKKTNKSWQESVKQLNDVSEKLKLAKDSYDTNSKALKEMQEKMETLKEPTLEMKDRFLALVEEVDKGKAAYEGFVKEQDKLTEEVIKKEKEYNNAKKSAKNLHITEKELAKEQEKIKNEFGNANVAIEKFTGLMQKSLAGIAAGFTVSTIVKGINESVEAFRTQERAVASLNQALMNSGTYTAEYSQHLQDLSSEIQSFSNYGDEATEQAIALGQSFSGNVKLTDELIRATVDYAAATGQDLQSAFTLVGKSIGTQTNALARYGVSLEDGMSKEQKMTKITETLSQRFNGSAKTMSNASVQLKNAIGDLSEEFGTAFNPAVEEAQKLLAGLTVKATDALKNIRVATKDIKNLTLAEAELRLEQANSGASFTRNWKINKDYIKSIEDRIKVLKEEESLKAKSSKDNFIPIADTSTTKTTSGTNKALEEYQSFVEQYKQATREYEATLKARNYVEKTLGIKTTDEDYQTALNVYKEYFAKRKEIEESGSKNKASLLKMEETKLQQDLQTIALQKTDETAKKQYELIKGYQDSIRNLTINEQAYQSAGGYLASFGDSFQQRLEIEKNYYSEREKIMQMTFNSEAEKQEAYNELSLLRTRELSQLQLTTWRGYGHDIKSIFDSTFNTMLTNYGSFGENMQQLALNISKKLLEIAYQEMIKEVSFEKIKQAAILTTKAIKGAFSFGIGAMFHSGGTIVPTEKHHYGGMTVPDQTEHFALLKNNERVLSPSETSAYNQNESNQNGQNYIVYAPQVRAMDSRDVAQWFNDNKQQVLSIVSDGIKNNNQGLRTQIQGV